MANLSNSRRPQGCASSALAATTAATADAAEPPRPEPSGMPFSICTSNPKSGRTASCRASKARPAVLSRGRVRDVPATPRMALIVTPARGAARAS